MMDLRSFMSVSKESQVCHLLFALIYDGIENNGMRLMSDLYIKLIFPPA